MVAYTVRAYNLLAEREEHVKHSLMIGEFSLQYELQRNAVAVSSAVSPNVAASLLPTLSEFADRPASAEERSPLDPAAAAGPEPGTPFAFAAPPMFPAGRAARSRARWPPPGRCQFLPGGASAVRRGFLERRGPPSPAAGVGLVEQGVRPRAAHTRAALAPRGPRSAKGGCRSAAAPTPRADHPAGGMAAAARAPGWAPRLVLLLVPLLLLRPQVSGAAVRGRGLRLQPPYFNLAKAAKIWATATCGEPEPDGGPPRPQPEMYCKLVGGPPVPGRGHAVTGQFCDYCNSEDPQKAHPITNAIDGTERWWQSPPLSSGAQYNRVNVTLDLGQLFQVAYILIKFANSPRPDLWVLERSVDFGKTYLPWQYFARSKQDCVEQFGQQANQALTRDDKALCVTEYSRIIPLENGEVVVSLINGRPGAKNFTFSHTLREFTKATNIRLRFLQTNTLLGHLISKAQRDLTVTRRYYYSIKDISIGGRCVCHGHAKACSANNSDNLLRCECQHHTCGETCDRCCPGYNQRQWQPATAEQSNECEACNCHGHATDCYYNASAELQQASVNTQGVRAGGGVCINCQHNTTGVNCERCAKGYYRPEGVPVDAPHGCIPCSCNPEHADGCEQGSGRCHCKPNFSGDSCEECAVGYYDFPVCLKCDCDPRGALNNSCDQTGQCPCHPHYAGRTCNQCAPDFYNYPDCLRE
ncbi:laminin subunit alpha-3-like [Tenrec ecaudatus]|uniref:laminin subunit alpha-3-like n=1 Tax=Tenrec ecaudatus TaxID=94439 RepID=UPI003F59E542